MSIMRNLKLEPTWMLYYAMAAILFLTTPHVHADDTRWAIALHGGAGNVSKDISPERLREYQSALNRALQTGEQILQRGGTSLDAVEATVMALEDAACFNAGRGGVFNAAGFHQLDASIMNGSDRSCGAVSAVEGIKNPIQAARLVMEKTPHVLLTGYGAEEFAKSQKLEMVSPDYFFDPTRWQQLIKVQEKAGGDVLTKPAYPLPAPSQTSPDTRDLDPSRGTVGCVALDQHGNLAAATSTGGLTSKMVGRVGDSPIIGAGTYADNDGCAVSGTGSGEEYIRNAIAFQVNWRVKNDQQPVDQAVEDCLSKVLKPGDGGIIAIDRSGKIVLKFNTGAMSRAWSSSSGDRGLAIWDEPLAD